MYIFARNAAEEVVALCHRSKGIGTDTNAVVGTIPHSTMLNGYIHIAQGFGDIDIAGMGTRTGFAAVTNVTIGKISESGIYFNAFPITGRRIGSFEKDWFHGCSIGKEFSRSGIILI